MPFFLTISYIVMWGIPFIFPRLHNDLRVAMVPFFGFGSRMMRLAFGTRGPVRRMIFAVLL